MDPDKIGATYFMRDLSQNVYVFSIKARQANDPIEDSEWGLWIGVISDSNIKTRVNEILDYLAAHNGPTRSELDIF